MKKQNTYTLRIIGSAPDKLPLDRLSLYLSEMAKLLGENSKVHLDRVGRGSAALKVWAEPEIACSVAKRVSLAVNGQPSGDKDAKKALDRINELLVQDGKRAELKNPEGAVIYPFPGGRKVLSVKELLVDEECTIIGQVIKIGGKDDTIPLLLRDSDGAEYPCTIRGEKLAKEISMHYLRGYIEISGTGKWRRSQDGKWSLVSMNVKSWSPLQDDWDAAYDALTGLAEGWSSIPNIEEHCSNIRKGH